MAEPTPLTPQLMRLLEMVEALRAKAMVLALWGGLVFMVAFRYSTDVIIWLKDLLLPQGGDLRVLSPVEWLLLQLKMASLAALVALLPPVCFLLWRYARRNLNLDLRLGWSRGAGMLVAAGLLFGAGVAYALYFMLPLLLNYLYQDAVSAGLEADYAIGEFIHFVLLLTVALGLSFQLPLVVWLLVRQDIVSYTTLAGYRRHVFVVFFILAAFITPPDVISQLVLAIPMAGLFEASLLLYRLVHPEAVLAEKGLDLDRKTPYPPRAALLLGGYATLLWLAAAIGLYGLFWTANLESWPAAPAREWLVTRPELLAATAAPVLLAPPLLLLGVSVSLGLRKKLTYHHLARLRPLLWAGAMVAAAWASPAPDPWPLPFLLLAAPLLLGLEAALALYRSAATHPLPQAAQTSQAPAEGAAEGAAAAGEGPRD